MKLNVLVLGSGGREHVLCEKIRLSPYLGKLFCAPGSDAIACLAVCADINCLSPKAVAAFAVENKINLVVVGPEGPLAAGVADELIKRKIACFGPTRRGARLESSKVFAKNFMKKYAIPTAHFKAFKNFSDVSRYLNQISERPLVVKASGLAGGKGVFVCESKEDALISARKLMKERIFKDAGERVVIEECLAGPELSAMALTDGRDFVLLPLSRDHKRLKDGDRGPNTGGMGAFAPVSVSIKTTNEIETIFRETLTGIRREKMDYRGLLYCGLMLTPEGVKVLEFNCRFGDPETQTALPLIQSDFLALLWATSQKKLKGLKIKVLKKSSVCVNLVSEGYPEKIKIGRKILGLGGENRGVQIFHCGTALKNGEWKTAGGRVLSVVAVGTRLTKARNSAYQSAAKIFFQGKALRKDIAK